MFSNDAKQKTKVMEIVDDTYVPIRECGVCKKDVDDDEDRRLYHVHSTCGQGYHIPCYDKLMILSRDDDGDDCSSSSSYCPYCLEKMVPRGVVDDEDEDDDNNTLESIDLAPFECIVCKGPILDDRSSTVYVHPRCHGPYHALCLETWLHTEKGRGCAYCRQPVLDRSQNDWFERNEIHEHLAEIFRRSGFDRHPEVVVPGGWHLPEFSDCRGRIRAVVANCVELEAHRVPFFGVPVLDSLRERFPTVEFEDGSCLLVPVLVEVDQLVAKHIPVYYVTSDEYRGMALREGKRYNEYARLFVRYFYFNPPKPSDYVSEYELLEENKPVNTDDDGEGGSK